MYLKQLNVFQFRNISDAELHPHPRLNILVGKNGQGKTNILESIYLLSNLKSFRNGKSSDFVQTDTEGSLIKGNVSDSQNETQYRFSISGTKRSAKINGKEPRRLADYFGEFTTVAFHPDDQKIIKGGPEGRRVYVDRSIFNLNSRYLAVVQNYQKALNSRNQLLKMKYFVGDDEFEAWENQLAEYGAQITKERFDWCNRAEKMAQNLVLQIAGNAGEKTEKFEIQYRPNPPENIGLLEENSIEMMSSNIRKALGENRSLDRLKRSTSFGPHRDDFEFILDGKPMKSHASQGQQRTAVLALKISEVERLIEEGKTSFGFAPVLLIDDFSSELDHSRRKKLFELIRDHKMQVFISTTEVSILEDFEKMEYSLFKVDSGKITQQKA